MGEEYDVIVLGTGLKECLIGRMMSVSKKKVLYMDRNKYYGGESATITPLEDVFQHFGTPFPNDTGIYSSGKDWHVDLTPKFLNMEALFDQFERRRLRHFLNDISDFDENDPNTNIPNMTCQELYDKFGLKDSADFVGYALAFYRNNDYRKENCPDLIKRIKRYRETAIGFSTPLIYPEYGLGEIIQGLKSLGASLQLEKPVSELVFGDDGKVTGVKYGEEIAKAKIVICDPSYAASKCKKVGQVVRAICILNHQIQGTEESLSCHIIIPQNAVNRKHHIYVTCLSASQCVTPRNFYLATLSTVVETRNPQDEIQLGLDLLGQIEQKFIYVSDLYEPLTNGKADNLYITKSYDATSDFETTCTDILDVFERASGSKWDNSTA